MIHWLLCIDLKTQQLILIDEKLLQKIEIEYKPHMDVKLLLMVMLKSKLSPGQYLHDTIVMIDQK